LSFPPLALKDCIFVQIQLQTHYLRGKKNKPKGPSADRTSIKDTWIYTVQCDVLMMTACSSLPNLRKIFFFFALRSLALRSRMFLFHFFFLSHSFFFFVLRCSEPRAPLLLRTSESISLVHHDHFISSSKGTSNRIYALSMHVPLPSPLNTDEW